MQLQTIDAPRHAGGSDTTDHGLEFEAALRALHVARVHLDEVAVGVGGASLVTRSRLLVGQALALLGVAARIHGQPADPAPVSD